MEDFSIGEMQQMQKALQEKYRHKWEPICPEVGKNKLLWMIGEIGEVIDIVKKYGGENAAANEDVRVQLVEELADVLSVLQRRSALLWDRRGRAQARLHQKI